MHHWKHRSDIPQQPESIILDVGIFKAEHFHLLDRLVVERILEVGIVVDVQELLFGDGPFLDGNSVVLNHRNFKYLRAE